MTDPTCQTPSPACGNGLDEGPEASTDLPASRWRRIPAWAAFVLTLLLPTLAQAAPALFRITTPTTTVYLFGSMHLLPPHTDWRTEAFDGALAQTKAEVFEIAQAPGVMMLFELGPALDWHYPLHKDLTPAQFAAIKAYADAAHLPMVLIDHMRPWLAALTLVSVAEARQTTLKPPGVDTQLMAAARTRNIPVAGLETTASLTALLDDLPRPGQLQMLREVLTPHPDETATNLDIFEAWSAGDVPRLEALDAHSRDLAPALFDALLRRRNEAWLPEIEAILHGDTPTLITVGAFHLFGPDGLLALLEHHGYQVERVQ